MRYETKVHRVGLKIYWVWKLHTKSSVIQISQNDLDFSLYTMPSIYYIVTTLEDGSKSERDEC